MCIKTNPFFRPNSSYRNVVQLKIAIDIDCIIYWFNIQSQIFMKLGGLLKCDYDLEMLPIKLSAFHQQILLYWKMIYRHHLSPHNTPPLMYRIVSNKLIRCFVSFCCLMVQNLILNIGKSKIMLPKQYHNL